MKRLILAALLAAFALFVAAPGGQQPLALSLSWNQTGTVEQQSCPSGGPAWPDCDPATWVNNPTGSLLNGPCAWDVDDNFDFDGFGYVDAGTTRSGVRCVVADAYNNWGGDDHMLFATVNAPANTLTVTLSNDQGVSLPMAPVVNGSGYRYYVCHVDHTPGPYPTIAGSNGGTGTVVTYTLSVTAGAHAVRSVSASLDAPLVGSSAWFAAWNAGCQ